MFPTKRKIGFKFLSKFKRAVNNQKFCNFSYYTIVSLFSLLILTLTAAFVFVNHAPSYPQLIFEDHFDWFDFQTWEHEITAWGGGVSDGIYFFFNFAFCFMMTNRTMNSSFITTIARTVM